MAQNFQSITLDLAEGVATLTLNRPERLNSFTEVMHAEIRKALESVRGERSTRALILTGAGRGFCAGQDLSDRNVAAGDGPRDLGASLAHAWGLIWQCVDDGELLATARKLAAQLASGPTLGFARIKQAIYAAEKNVLDAQLELERDLQRELGRTGDYREGVSAFLQKRAPAFRGE